jgi:hypothetical protein
MAKTPLPVSNSSLIASSDVKFCNWFKSIFSAGCGTT